MCSDKEVLADLDPSVNRGIRIFGWIALNPPSCVTKSTLWLMVTWLPMETRYGSLPKVNKFAPRDLDTLAYLDALATEASDGILMKPRGVFSANFKNWTIMVFLFEIFQGCVLSSVGCHGNDCPPLIGTCRLSLLGFWR